MGFFDNLKNISKEAKRQAKKKSQEVKEELEKEFGDEQLYKNAKDFAKATIDEGKNLSKSVVAFSKSHWTKLISKDWSSPSVIYCPCLNLGSGSFPNSSLDIRENI